MCSHAGGDPHGGVELFVVFLFLKLHCDRSAQDLKDKRIKISACFREQASENARRNGEETLSRPEKL